MSLNLGTIVRASSADRPDAKAVLFDERSLTYAELDRWAQGISAGLRECGVQPGDTVALLIPNVPESLVAWTSAAIASNQSSADPIDAPGRSSECSTSSPKVVPPRIDLEVSHTKSSFF